MPVYTYQCDHCGVRFDHHQKFTDQPLTWCPECHKKALRKVYTPVGIVFKGSGFYATDHRSPSGTASHAAGNRADEPKSTSESETKAEAKTGAAKPVEAAAAPAKTAAES